MDRQFRNRLRTASETGSQEDLAALGALVLRQHGRPEGEHEPCPECTSRTDPAQDYQAAVAEIVSEARDGVSGTGDLDSADALSEFIWQSVDSSEWVIYPHRARQALAASENDGYAIDNWGIESAVENGRISWERLAFGALYADVMDALHDEMDVNTPFMCSECGDLHEYRTGAVECCMDDDLVGARIEGFERAAADAEEEALDEERQSWER